MILSDSYREFSIALDKLNQAILEAFKNSEILNIVNAIINKCSQTVIFLNTNYFKESKEKLTRGQLFYRVKKAVPTNYIHVKGRTRPRFREFRAKRER